MFSFIKLITCLNKVKSACFWVNKGYLSKWGIIAKFRSFKDWTEYITEFDLLFL